MYLTAFSEFEEKVHAPPISQGLRRMKIKINLQTIKEKNSTNLASLRDDSISSHPLLLGIVCHELSADDK